VDRQGPNMQGMRNGQKHLRMLHISTNSGMGLRGPIQIACPLICSTRHLFSQLLDVFVEQSPVAVLVRAALENEFSDERFDTFVLGKDPAAAAK
jgi:hypothetical protein